MVLMTGIECVRETVRQMLRKYEEHHPEMVATLRHVTLQPSPKIYLVRHMGIYNYFHISRYIGDHIAT